MDFQDCKGRDQEGEMDFEDCKGRDQDVEVNFKDCRVVIRDGSTWWVTQPGEGERVEQEFLCEGHCKKAHQYNLFLGLWFSPEEFAAYSFRQYAGPCLVDVVVHNGRNLK